MSHRSATPRPRRPGRFSHPLGGTNAIGPLRADVEQGLLTGEQDVIQHSVADRAREIDLVRLVARRCGGGLCYEWRPNVYGNAELRIIGLPRTRT